jgi:hypothetical protein
MEGTPEAIAELEAWLREARYEGGQDPNPALERAWELAASQPGGRVIWVHAPHPVALSESLALQQALARRPDGPSIYSLSTRIGPERLLERDIGRTGKLTPVPRLGDVATDLLSVLHFGGLGQPRWLVERPADSSAELLSDSDHVARFAVARWAEEIARRGTPAERVEALAQATRLRLITPFTGAVVLETRAQFDRAGLTPATSDSVPAVPEPSTVALLAVAGASAVAAWRRRKRSAPC